VVAEDECSRTVQRKLALNYGPKRRSRASPSMNHLRRLDFFGKSRLRKHLILARRAFRAIAVTRSKPTMRAGDGIAPTSPSGMEPWILRINVEIAISRRRLRGLPTCPDESGRVALVPVRRRHARARRRSDRCAVQGPSSELAEPGVETPPPDHPVEGGVIKHVFLYPFRRGVRRRHIGLLYATSTELRACGRRRLLDRELPHEISIVSSEKDIDGTRLGDGCNHVLSPEE